ncbi:response regulator [Desulfococcaceae bacterium HSG9]|nr:response regulator [Desulfococcaceae bacterium HSG9]
MPHTILIVDDEPGIVVPLEFLMKKSGYTVLIARTGEEALQWIEKKTPDLILLDLMLPLCSGFEICQKIREHPQWKSIKIIILTAKSRETDMAKGIALGADAYVTKPFSTHKLVEMVSEMVNNIQK